MSRPPLKDRNTTKGLVDLGPIPDLSPVASFNIGGIHNLLETVSFKAIVYHSAYLPDQETISSPMNPNTQGAQRGFFYYSAREIGVVPQSFKLEDRLTVQGIYGAGSALFNVTGTYLDGDREVAYVKNRDLIVLPDITEPYPQKIEFNPNGPQKLLYKAKGVDYLADNKTVYNEGFDFEVVNGLIHWLPNGRKPFFSNGKGAVLSIVYYHNPIYIVQNLPHNLRLIPSNPQGHAAYPREETYAPQLLIVKPSTIMEESDIMDWTALPDYNEYPNSSNTTGGSR